jgi:DNA repair protein RecO (recombination protein O)
MPGPLRAEALVLRSIRYGEADRILHLYTLDGGRVSAIAKGVRRARSRFGGRLEPFSHVRLLLHEGRGELLTVTSAETIAARKGLREHAAALDSAARACDAVARLFDGPEANPAVFNLLANELALLDLQPQRATRANQLAFRLKLLVAAGFGPQLASCASCGEAEHIHGYSPAAGGVVCAACEAGAFPLDEEAYGFLVGSLGAALADAPAASERALGQAERALSETLEHHAHVRWRAAAA